MTTAPSDGRFWELAELFLADGAEQSTMMGFPCLRLDGAFFASVDHRTGELIVKLPSSRVDELLENGMATPFAPNGRRFKEWATIPHDCAAQWTDLMGEAASFATQNQ